MPFNKAAVRGSLVGQPGANMVAPVPAVAFNRSRSPRTSGRLAPARMDTDRVKHDQLRVLLHILRHLLEPRLSNETSESFDLLRHLRFSLGIAKLRFRPGTGPRPRRVATQGCRTNFGRDGKAVLVSLGRSIAGQHRSAVRWARSRTLVVSQAGQVRSGERNRIRRRPAGRETPRRCHPHW